jgi:hypothetical protein
MSAAMKRWECAARCQQVREIARTTIRTRLAHVLLVARPEAREEGRSGRQVDNGVWKVMPGSKRVVVVSSFRPPYQKKPQMLTTP